ncbi:hypothetical protein Tco_0260792 [Tanacetum coccineum]
MYQNTAHGKSPVKVTAPPSKPSRRHQKRMADEEEIVLCKGWVHVFENSAKGNARKIDGLWTEVLAYLRNKTKQPGRRAYGYWVGSSGSSMNMTNEALARLMVFELATETESAMAMKKEERATYMEIKRRWWNVVNERLQCKNIGNVKKTRGSICSPLDWGCTSSYGSTKGGDKGEV